MKKSSGILVFWFLGVFGLFPFSSVCSQVVLPLDVKPFQKMDALVKKFSDKGIATQPAAHEEGHQSLVMVKAEWKDANYDSVIFDFTGEPEELTGIRVVRVCNEHSIDKATQDLNDDLTKIYGAPSDDALEYALWQRGLKQIIFLGRALDNQSVYATFDVDAMLYRRAETDPDWPYHIPIDATRDEIEKTITKSCGRIITKEDLFVTTAGCLFLGVTSHKMIVWNDEGGMITKFEAHFDPSQEPEIRETLIKRYGKQTGGDANKTSWRFAGPDDAVRIDHFDEDIVVTIDVLALERKQYAE